MGYFKYKIDRGRARRAKAALGPPVIGPSEWRTPVESPSPVFVRLTIPVLGEYSHLPLGLFHGTYLIEDWLSDFPDWERELDEALAWFSEHLPAPNEYVDPHAIFWFKPTAKACLERARSVVQILQEAGQPVTVQTTRRPGIICYEDNWQFAAIRLTDAKVRTRPAQRVVGSGNLPSGL